MAQRSGAAFPSCPGFARPVFREPGRWLKCPCLSQMAVFKELRSYHQGGRSPTFPSLPVTYLLFLKVAWQGPGSFPTWVRHTLRSGVPGSIHRGGTPKPETGACRGGGARVMEGPSEQSGSGLQDLQPTSSSPGGGWTPHSLRWPSRPASPHPQVPEQADA